MEKINDNEIYLKRMKRTFADKMWFMSLIPDGIKHIVDFGCADNSFLREFNKIYPGYDCIGIDNNPDFLDMAKKSGEKVFDSLETVLNGGVDPSKTLLVMNSVIHEIYSYSDPEKVWGEIKKAGFKYIAIRDMYAKGCGYFTSRTALELQQSCMKAQDEQRVPGIFIKYLRYVETWLGPNINIIDNGYDALHFLLKYFYEENWSRELKENYIPYHYRDFHKLIRRNGYDVKFEQFYALPYLKEKWKHDLNCKGELFAFIEQVTTHMKLFLVKEAE